MPLDTTGWTPDQWNTWVETTSKLHDQMVQSYEPYFKGAHYLLVAHGAGLAGTLAFLKDGKDNPAFKGLGFLVTLFAYGFMFAAVGFLALIAARKIDILRAIHQQPRKRGDEVMSLLMFGLSGLSLLILLGALWFISRRAAEL